MNAPVPWPLELASQVSDGLRGLVVLTASAGSAYADPADVYEVLVELGIGVTRLPQVLDQASTWLANTARDGCLGDDRGYSPSGAKDTAHAAMAALDDARHLALDLYAALDRAAQHASHLTTTSSKESTS